MKTLTPPYSTNFLVEKNVKNGRFIFSSRESLEATIEDIEKDDGNEIQVPIGTDYSGTGKFKVKPADDYFRNYTHYELDFYGMARRGDTWRENRMIRD